MLVSITPSPPPASQSQEALSELPDSSQEMLQGYRQLRCLNQPHLDDYIRRYWPCRLPGTPGLLLPEAVLHPLPLQGYIPLEAPLPSLWKVRLRTLSLTCKSLQRQMMYRW